MWSIFQVYLSFTGFLAGNRCHGDGKMDETTRLLDNSICVDMKDTKKFKTELTGNYEYFAAPPLWIKIRLILFWMFWAAFVAVVILFVFIKWCFISNLCAPSMKNRV